MSKKTSNQILKKIVVRNLTLNDYDQIVELQLRCFPNMKPWNTQQFKNIVSVFPDGQICVEFDGKIIASSCSLIIESAKYSETSSWQELTDKGYITNHSDEGDTLYGMEIMVDPEFRNMKLARRLYDKRKALAVRLNLKRIAIGGRLPEFHKHKDKMDVYAYVNAVTDKKIFDPVLTTQLANGFSLKKVLPDYLPNDENSCGYATYLEWPNLSNERCKGF
jgi:ribosomal protein S18 acetylase RimI-like enzyme